MATRKMTQSEKLFFERLGHRVEKMILIEKEYSSLDAFSLEHYDLIAKPTLYQICDGKRDMKVSTLRNLARALGITFEALIAGL